MDSQYKLLLMANELYLLPAQSNVSSRIPPQHHMLTLSLATSQKQQTYLQPIC